MARRTARPTPTAERTLVPLATTCAACGHRLHPDYSNFRTLTTLDGVTRYTLRVGRCRHRPCDLYAVPFRPEAEVRLALPHHEFGLDVWRTPGAAGTPPATPAVPAPSSQPAASQPAAAGDSAAAPKPVSQAQALVTSAAPASAPA